MKIMKIMAYVLVIVFLTLSTACSQTTDVNSKTNQTSTPVIDDENTASSNNSIPDIPSVDSSEYALTNDEVIKNLEDIMNGQTEKILINIPKEKLEDDANFYWTTNLLSQYPEYTEDCYKLYISNTIKQARERISTFESFGKDYKVSLSIESSSALTKGMTQFNDLEILGEIQEAYVINCTRKISGANDQQQDDYRIWTVKMNNIWYPVRLNYSSDGKFQNVSYIYAF